MFKREKVVDTWIDAEVRQAAVGANWEWRIVRYTRIGDNTTSVVLRKSSTFMSELVARREAEKNLKSYKEEVKIDKTWKKI